MSTFLPGESRSTAVSPALSSIRVDYGMMPHHVTKTSSSVGERTAVPEADSDVVRRQLLYAESWVKLLVGLTIHS